MSRLERCKAVNWDWVEFLYDARVQAMDAGQLGVWVRLLGAFALAESPGRILGDEEALRRASGSSEEGWVRARDLILGALDRDGGWWIHRRTERDHAAQTLRIQQASTRGRAAVLRRYKVPYTERTTDVLPPSLLPPSLQKKKQSVRATRSLDDFSDRELPDAIPADVWRGWCQYRKSLEPRFKWTKLAADLVVKRLSELVGMGYPAREVVEMSIRNGWRDVFPLRQDAASKPSSDGWEMP